MAAELFTYKAESGDTIKIKKFKHLPVGLIRKIRTKSNVDQMFTVIEAVANDATLAIIDEMDTDEFNAFTTAWQKDSGISVGESTASSES